MKKKSNSKVSESIIPIPHDLAGLPTIEAETWFQINPGTDALIEGPAFDREGNLFVSVCNLGQIVKIAPHKKME